MKQTTRNDYARRIARVTEAIFRDPARARALEEWAALANFSPFHFHRVYRAMQGESIADTIRRARLTLAARALAMSARSVTDIALEAGYENAQSFARAFRGFVAMSPTQFRATHRAAADFTLPSPIVVMRKDAAMNVEIVELAPIRAHLLEHKGPVASIPETWESLWRWHMQAGLAGRALYPIGVSYDDPEEDCGFRYCAGLVFPEGVAASGAVTIAEIPGGRYASYRHIGPYSGIAAAFQRLYGEWLPTSGHEPDDRPALEIYRNTPYDAPPDGLITDLLIPVK